MKLTKHKLHKLIEETLKEGDDDKRPWFHGPFESDWDRKQKAKQQGNEAQEIYKILKGWWAAAAVNEHIRESYHEPS